MRFGRGARRPMTSIVATLAAFGWLGTADAGAAEQHAYAVAMNYATATITMGQGDKLTFTNLDNIYNGKHGSVAGELKAVAVSNDGREWKPAATRPTSITACS